MLGRALQHLEPQLGQLAPDDMSALLYGLSRAHFPLPGPTKDALSKVRWLAPQGL